MNTEHHVRASSFADPADVAGFKKWYRIYLDRGMSPRAAEEAAFKKGDNAIGCWGDSTAEGSGPSCALPPEDMEERWGSVAAAKHKQVKVEFGPRVVVCTLKDRMPHRANIENGAGIDLNPDAVKALGMKPPIMVPAAWSWV